MPEETKNPWSADDSTEKQCPTLTVSIGSSKLPANNDQGCGNNKDATDYEDNSSVFGLEKSDRCGQSDKDENVWSGVSTSPLAISLDLIKTGSSQQIKVESKEPGFLPDNHEDFSSIDDDFGAFETLPTVSIKYYTPLTELMTTIFPDSTKVFNPLPKKYDRDIILTRENTLVMKYYNNLIGNSRKYGVDKNSIANFRRRGYLEKTELHKDILKVSKEWTIIEKGLDMISPFSTDPPNNSSTTGKMTINALNWGDKQNIFRWSTKVDDDTKEDTTGIELRNKKQVGQKLLNVSFEKAREIIEDRMEIQKKERTRLEKEKQERDDRLRKEQMKREEEIKKYSLKNGQYSEQKKKGLLKRIFGGKSKIAKDHISHDKVINDDEDNIIDEKNISLKEHFQRRSNFISSEHNLNKSGNDSDDDDDDNDSDFDIQGYNQLDGNGTLDDENNNLQINFIDDDNGDHVIDHEELADQNIFLKGKEKGKGLNTKHSIENVHNKTFSEKKDDDENFGSLVLPKPEKADISKANTQNISTHSNSIPSIKLANVTNEPCSHVTNLDNKGTLSRFSESSSDEFEDFIVAQNQSPQDGKQDHDEFDNFVKFPVEQSQAISDMEKSNTRVDGLTSSLQQPMIEDLCDYTKPKELSKKKLVSNKHQLNMSCEVSEELVPTLSENFATFCRKSVVKNSDSLSRTSSLARPKRKPSIKKNFKVHDESNLIDL